MNIVQITEHNSMSNGLVKYSVSVLMSPEMQVLVLYSPCKESGIGASLQNASVSGRQDGWVGVEVPGGKFGQICFWGGVGVEARGTF